MFTRNETVVVCMGGSRPARWGVTSALGSGEHPPNRNSLLDSQGKKRRLEAEPAVPVRHVRVGASRCRLQTHTDQVDCVSGTSWEWPPDGDAAVARTDAGTRPPNVRRWH